MYLQYEQLMTRTCAAAPASEWSPAATVSAASPATTGATTTTPSASSAAAATSPATLLTGRDEVVKTHVNLVLSHFELESLISGICILLNSFLHEDLSG